MADSLDAALASLQSTPEFANGEALKNETETLPPSQEVFEADLPSNFPATPVPLPGRKACRHCGADFAAEMKNCPACGKSQRGAPPGPRKPKQPQQIEPVKPPPPPLTEGEILKLESALADTFEFALEDVAAPLMFRRAGVPSDLVPKLGEKRAGKLGAVWAPFLAPYMNARVLIWILVIVVSLKSLGSYFRECGNAISKYQANKTP